MHGIVKPERKRQLGRSRFRWKETIKLDLKEIRRKSVDWIHLAQDMDQRPTPVNTTINAQLHKRLGIS
jgi:hypothetical protein